MITPRRAPRRAFTLDSFVLHHLHTSRRTPQLMTKTDLLPARLREVDKVINCAAGPNDYRALVLMDFLFAYLASGLTQLYIMNRGSISGQGQTESLRLWWCLGSWCAAVTASFHRPLLGCPSLDLPEQQLASSAASATTADGVVDVRSLSCSATFAGWSRAVA